MIHINYELYPFRTDIAVIFANTVTEGLKYMIDACDAKLSINPEDEQFTNGITGHGLDVDGLNAWYIVFNKNQFNIGLLAHECYHAINYITNSKGMIYNSDSEEYYAYALHDMVNYINNEYCNRQNQKQTNQNQQP